MDSEYDSDDTVMADELDDQHAPSMLADKTKTNIKWVEKCWERWVRNKQLLDPEIFVCDLRMLFQNLIK